MKKFKNSPVKPEPAKLQPIKVEPIKRVLVKAYAPKSDAVKPEALKTETVSFELVQPGAHRVCVAGSFNDWKPESSPLAPLENGRWAGDLAIKPGRYEYLFVVDGQWVLDPNAKESVQNPFGGRNSILGVSV
jgi:1,4-alpha-glucan branching enzyme